MLAAAGEVGLFCTLRAKRCRRVRSLSLSVPAALARIKLARIQSTPAMVASAPLTARWQMAERLAERLLDSILNLFSDIKAGQAAPGMRVEIHPTMRVEAAVALENQGVMDTRTYQVVTAARVFNRPYLVPPIFMAAVAAATPAQAPLAMENWVEVGKEVTEG